MLRQAPNIILIGEIRDLDVAEVAIQAALTGHLVFSTLHTNDAPSALTRLIDMGVKPFLVASSIQAIMAQRLVRRICPECKDVDHDPDPRTLKLLGFTDDEVENTTFYIGRGCNQCNGTGYRGRQGIFEVMEMTSALRQLAFDRAPLTEIRKAAIASGMSTLLDDGKMKIRHGITTPEEVAKTAQAEDVMMDE
jgi:type IV pilus assembly protein PilB